MPYIQQYRRKELDAEIDQLAEKIEAEGELNYVFTRLAAIFTRKLRDKGWGEYGVFNAVMGIFESAKLEFYRRRVVPYEDQKIEENGDV